MQALTICFFSAQYLPGVGGVERYTWNLARRTAAAGHHAVVVTSALPHTPALPPHETDMDGIEIFRLPVWPLMRGRFPVLKPGRRFAVLTRRLWRLPVDFCVIQTRMYTESVWAARAARRRGIPAIVIDHSTGYMPMGGGLPGLCGRLYEQAACAAIRRAGPRFYGVSGAVCAWLARGFGIRAAGTLPNAVAPEELAALAAQETASWRAALGAAENCRLVAYVGRLIPEKGAAALAEAVRDMPDVALAVAGDGPLLEQLRSSSPPNVVCLGSVSHAGVIRLLQQADVCCLPTCYAEGFPTTLLEAAACRCPIVCTRTAGTDELLPGPEYGVLLDGAGPQEIRAGLQAMLADEGRRRRCAENTYRNLLAHFTWDSVFDQLMEVARTAPEERP